MLASQVLKGEAQSWQVVREPKAPRRAARNWRVLLDKLYGLQAWGYWQTVVSQWMILPESSPAASSQDVVVSKSDKGEAYQHYLQSKKPERMANVKGVGARTFENCNHTANQLKGGGNAHGNWFHCAECHARWKLSPRTASLLTGKSKTIDVKEDTALKVSEKIAKDQALRADKARETQVGDLMQQIMDERAKVRALQEELDMKGGCFQEYEQAQQTAILLEMHYAEMEASTQSQVTAIVSEFHRLAMYEKELRRKSNMRPIPEVVQEWNVAVDNLKKSAAQINLFHSQLLEQRSQVAQNLRRS